MDSVEGIARKNGMGVTELGKIVRDRREWRRWIEAERSVTHGAIGCYQKSFKLVRRWHQLLSGFLADGKLP